ncbi:ATP-binding protein of sugar ABC transportor [Crocosphaera subtropica ATCC 51142]|uniref:ATP-binding protein of sugar ABC transportor n=1 Tax=Crocosphaera subtropica (strain ATCC 51142 / BH68) TaxID=43989 RepID=B1X0C6_CROS5|nr:ATP-binding cassette domain-containing protein [Crocosphaera subtropica]ACB49627.1 ATP-binding protein of sugar ABC transportor [Crocosphaera subtropica ATCC 51142]
MAKLRLENLTKQYQIDQGKTLDVVKGISNVEVEDGEFLTLLGPSGCGKSTLLRLIAGLEPPTKGDIFIGEKKVTNIAPGDRNIAMVFQSYALYPHMTAKENIATALKIRNLSEEEIDQRIQTAAKQLKLQEGKDCLPEKPGKLSGGQRQRVALARALVRNPEVFLLDEPLSNLDALLREQVRAELKQIFTEQNKPVVYVTHDQTEAMTLSDKVAVLFAGEIQQLASPREIYQYPANQFVAGFVGSPQMNLLELECQNNKAILGQFGIPLTSIAPENIPEVEGESPGLKHIVLGIRPEDIHEATEGDALVIHGQIKLVEELGKESLISVQIDQSDLVIRALLKDDGNKKNGNDISLALPEQNIHWFYWDGSGYDPDGKPLLSYHQRYRLNQ